jgi:hypothetical protein
MSQQPPGPAYYPPPPPSSSPGSPTGGGSGPSRQGLVIVLVVVGLVAILGGGYALTRDDDGGTPSDPPELDEAAGLDDLPDAGTSEPDPAAETGETGPPIPPPGTVPQLDDLAQGCYEGSMEDCEALSFEAVTIQFDNEAAIDYTIYGDTCGGRREDAASPVSCVERVPDP